MLRWVVSALLLAAVVHGHNGRHHGRSSTGPGSSRELNKPAIDMPDDIPIAWKVQLHNIFDRYVGI